MASARPSAGPDPCTSAAPEPGLPRATPAQAAPAAAGNGNQDLAVQLLRMAPYLSSGTTLSCVLAAGAVSCFNIPKFIID